MTTALTIFALLNALGRFAVGGVLVFKLFCFRETFNNLERAGMSISAGSCFLTIPVILDLSKSGTPMDGWAGTVFTFGVLVYFLGRLQRLRAHSIANRRMNEDARRHLTKKGKL